MRLLLTRFENMVWACFNSGLLLGEEEEIVLE